MGIQRAVASSVLTPGLYLLVNLLAGTSNPGSQALKGCFMAPSSTVGTLTQDTELRLIGSPDDAKTAWGTKTPGYVAAVQFFNENPNGVLYGVAPTRSGGAFATATWTFASTPSATRTVRFTVAGRIYDTTWATGETADTLKARAITGLNGRDDVSITGTSGGTGIITATFPVAGPWGNDCTWKVEFLDGAGGTINGGQSASGNLAGGTTEPDFTTALNTISGSLFDVIGIGVSNADADSASTTSNPGRVKTHINGLESGLNAKLQFGLVGVTGLLSSAKTGVVGRNEESMEYVFCMAGQSLPAEFCGAEMGAMMRTITIDPAANRIGCPLSGCVGAADLVADTPTAAEEEDALQTGLSIIVYTANGSPLVSRPVTTHSQDTLGNTDNRCRDTSGVHGTYAVSRDIQLSLPVAFSGVAPGTGPKISKDLVAGDDPLPEGVVEERDVKSEVISRLRFWSTRGVVRRDKLDAAIAAGTIIVQVDASDESQVNIVIPLGIFKPLAKFSVVVNKAA